MDMPSHWFLHKQKILRLWIEFGIHEFLLYSQPLLIHALWMTLRQRNAFVQFLPLIYAIASLLFGDLGLRH